jgi:ankyrin repeat protein
LFLYTRQAARGHANDCAHLLKLGIDPNEVVAGENVEGGLGEGELEFVGCTPLHFAAANGHVDAARILLEHGAMASARTGAYYLRTFAAAA